MRAALRKVLVVHCEFVDTAWEQIKKPSKRLEGFTIIIVIFPGLEVLLKYF